MDYNSAKGLGKGKKPNWNILMVSSLPLYDIYILKGILVMCIYNLY